MAPIFSTDFHTLIDLVFSAGISDSRCIYSITPEYTAMYHS